MTGTVRVFVNDRALDLPVGADALTAARAFDPHVADRLAEGSAHLTDGCGLPLSGDTPLASGSILRLIVSSRRPRTPDAR